ncbi:unnamed protein product [Durusdinium trenchii]
MAGNLLSICGTITSVLTIIIGLIYVANKPPKFIYYWNTCSWVMDSATSTDCNQLWQNNFGMTAVPKYTALIFGLIGTAMLQPLAMQVCGFPRNFVQYGLFLWLQGFYGDFGYCGKLGVWVGCLSCFVGTVCFIGAWFDLKSSRMLRLEEEYKYMYDAEDFEYTAAGAAAGAAMVAGEASPDSKDLFDKFDTDGDGRISRQELSSGLSRGLGRPLR